jgi:hypothetical protein
VRPFNREGEMEAVADEEGGGEGEEVAEVEEGIEVVKRMDDAELAALRRCTIRVSILFD